MTAQRDRPVAKPNPQMVEAGAEVIWKILGDEIAWGDDAGRELAELVYEAMASQSSQSSCEPPSSLRSQTTKKLRRDTTQAQA